MKLLFDYKDKIESYKDTETNDITLREGLAVQVTYYEKLTNQTKVELGFIKFIFDSLIIVESVERKGKLFHLNEEYIYSDYTELANYTYSENKNVTAVIMTKCNLPVEIMDDYLLGRPRQVDNPKSRGFYIPPIDDTLTDQDSEEIQKKSNRGGIIFTAFIFFIFAVGISIALYLSISSWS